MDNANNNINSNNNNNNWRNELSHDSRQKIVNKIMDTLQRHMPPTGADGTTELRKIALRFEEKIYTAATDQQDYLRKISLKMLSLRNHVTVPNPLAGSSGSNQKQLDPGHMTSSQLRNNGLSLPGQTQPQQPLLQQNLQGSLTVGGMQSSTGLPSTLSSMTSLPQSTSGQVFGTQNTLNNSTGQVLPQTALLANAQRQMHSRQQQVAQQHQQPQAQHQHLYQHQLQHQQQHLQNPQQQALLKEKFQQQSHLAPSILQQPQQPVMQQNQLQTSQQSILQSAQAPPLQSTQQSLLRQSQPSVLQPAQQSPLQTSQSFLQQHQQSLLRQQQSIIQQQQQPSILQQQQQPSMFNVSNMQQQQQQLQQIMQSKNSQYQQTQQASPSLLQPQSQQLSQQPQQQQLLSQLQHQPQQLQQQQSLLPQSNSVQQDLQQRLHTSGGLLQQQQQQSSVEQQKQLLQVQSQTQRLSDVSTTSVESSGQTGQSTVADWQEKMYQKLQKLKDIYIGDLKDIFQKLQLKSQQPIAADQLERIKVFKNRVQRTMQYFQVPKSNIPLNFTDDKLDQIEKQIQSILNSFKPVKPALQQQQGHQQLLSQSGSQGHSMQQQSQPPISQMQQQEKHANQLQQMNLQASVMSMQPNTVTPLQHSSMPQLQQSGMQTTLQNMRTTMQPGANLNSTQGSGVGVLQQSSFQHSNNNNTNNNNINGLQQNNGTLQQNSINSLQQSGNNPLQQNDLNSLQLNANTSQHHHQPVKPQDIFQVQQFKNLQQRQIQMQQQHQQFQQQHSQIQQQQQLQHLQQQQKQQQAAQMQAQQMPQFQQMNDLNSESKSKQASVIKQAFLPQHQHHTLSQRPVYQQQQQLKTGAALSVSSPQLLPVASPQVSQQASPQLDQQSLASSLQVPKLGTPIQPATSPFTAPSPSTLPLPSPMEDVEKQSSAISSISNTGSGQGLQHTANALNHSQSLAIGTPGISASPLLADFSSSPAQNIINQDGHQNVLPGLLMEDKSSAKEPPIKRLIKVMNSTSPKAFVSAVNDIASVVSLNDRLAGSAPGNGSKAAVGEDLVAMTKCRLQARNLVSQDGSATTKKMSRCISSMPLSTVSSGGSVSNSVQQHNSQESPEMESTASSKIKRPRVEMSIDLEDELREINQQLIDTIANVSEDDNDVAAAAAAAEGRDGIVVKCSYNAIALSPNMKSRYRSSIMTPISPLRLLIPASYPNCSPVILDKVPIELCNEYEDLSSRAKAKFHAAVRTLPQPMSLKALAKTWDVCARSTVAEFARQSGGGSFSSRFGTWESCRSA